MVDQITKLVATIAVGMACGLLFKKIHVPAGYMIGAFVGVAALGIVASAVYLPDGTSVAIQVIAGGFVGCSMERSDVKRLGRIGRPVALMLFSFLVLNFGLGLLVWAISPLDLTTSLMSCVPGGINDTPVVAADMGADAPVVAVMQLLRQVLGVAVIPSAIFAYDRFQIGRGNPGKRDAAAVASTDGRKKSSQKSWQATLATIAVAAAAGAIGKATGIPGMTFACSIVAVLVLKLAFDFAYIPRWMKHGCQILAGCYLGSLLSWDGLTRMGGLAIPMFVVVLGYMVNCLAVGKLESRLFGYGRKEGMLIASPAGAADMALIIEDLDVRNQDVVVMQVVRAVVVMALFPQLINIVRVAVGG